MLECRKRPVMPVRMPALPANAYNRVLVLSAIIIVFNTTFRTCHPETRAFFGYTSKRRVEINCWKNKNSVVECKASDVSVKTCLFILRMKARQWREFCKPKFGNSDGNGPGELEMRNKMVHFLKRYPNFRMDDLEPNKVIRSVQTDFRVL